MLKDESFLDHNVYLGCELLHLHRALSLR